MKLRCFVWMFILMSFFISPVLGADKERVYSGEPKPISEGELKAMLDTTHETISPFTVDQLVAHCKEVAAKQRSNPQPFSATQINVSEKKGAVEVKCTIQQVGMSRRSQVFLYWNDTHKTTLLGPLREPTEADKFPFSEVILEDQLKHFKRSPTGWVVTKFTR